MSRQSMPVFKFQQNGATLVVGLVILALLTVVGLASLDVTTVDVKVVANSKDRQLAFNGAESALFDGGLVVRDHDGALDNNSVGYVGSTYSSTADWWNSSGNWSMSAVSGSVVDSDFAIQEPTVRRAVAANNISNLTMGATGPVTRHGFYPTTARSEGPGNAVVVLQSHFVKRLYNNIAR